jgi:hypothetical protein
VSPAIGDERVCASDGSRDRIGLSTHARADERLATTETLVGWGPAGKRATATHDRADPGAAEPKRTVVFIPRTRGAGLADGLLAIAPRNAVSEIA